MHVSLGASHVSPTASAVGAAWRRSDALEDAGVLPHLIGGGVVASCTHGDGTRFRI